jgi:hypothetical protein
VIKKPREPGGHIPHWAVEPEKINNNNNNYYYYYYKTYKCPSPVPLLSQIKPVHPLPPTT